jgi:hypothetical protein
MDESIFGLLAGSQPGPPHKPAPSAPTSRTARWLSSNAAILRPDLPRAAVVAAPSRPSAALVEHSKHVVESASLTSPSPSPSPSSTAADDALIAILQAPITDGETVAAGFARKEAEIRQVFGLLSVLESRAMYQRLSSPKAGDSLATAFMRLTADRRARLVQFLGDARRRHALAHR